MLYVTCSEVTHVQKSRIYSMQWSEYCVNGYRKADCLHVLQTTFMEPGQPRPPESIFYTETVDRNCIQHEYQQQVLLMSNVNPIFASPSGCAVWGEGPGRLVPEITSSNPTLESPENDSAGMTCLRRAPLCTHWVFARQLFHLRATFQATFQALFCTCA